MTAFSTHREYGEVRTVQMTRLGQRAITACRVSSEVEAAHALDLLGRAEHLYRHELPVMAADHIRSALWHHVPTEHINERVAEILVGLGAAEDDAQRWANHDGT